MGIAVAEGVATEQGIGNTQRLRVVLAGRALARGVLATDFCGLPLESTPFGSTPPTSTPLVSTPSSFCGICPWYSPYEYFPGEYFL